MTELDVQGLIAAVAIAQTEWVNGVVNPLLDLREGTIFGPFGGPAGGGPELDETQSRIAALFHDGSAELEIANTIVSGDVVCLALVELLVDAARPPIGPKWPNTSTSGVVSTGEARTTTSESWPNISLS